MKYVITEKQLANLIVKQQSEDLEYEHVDDADPSKDDFVIGQEMDEQDSDVGSSSSSEDYGKSMSADEYPPYPERPKWGDQGQTPERGPANTIATGAKWGESGQKPEGGAANQSF